ncbi:MAG: TlpA disulfide reductase family protein [Candidatus Acidiferrales bacterium]|jgi:thiol-disulfide isomerase/thioredoxin
MTFLRRVLPWLVLAAALTILIGFAMPSYRQGEASIAGRTAPQFTFEHDGKQMRLADLHGKVVVVNFWATWCPPCVEETPLLNRLEQRIASRGGVVLGISVDEDPDAYERFLQDQKVAYPTFRDPSKKIPLEYGTSMYPETYIVDRHGRIARKIIGPQQWDSPDMLAYLDHLLGQS